MLNKLMPFLISTESNEAILFFVINYHFSPDFGECAVNKSVKLALDRAPVRRRISEPAK